MKNSYAKCCKHTRLAIDLPYKSVRFVSRLLLGLSQNPIDAGLAKTELSGDSSLGQPHPGPAHDLSTLLRRNRLTSLVSRQLPNVG